MTDLHIRSALRNDAGLVPGFIRELTEHEKLDHEIEATESLLAKGQ